MRGVVRGVLDSSHLTPAIPTKRYEWEDEEIKGGAQGYRICFHMRCLGGHLHCDLALGYRG
jgi:hypothetical protein